MHSEFFTITLSSYNRHDEEKRNNWQSLKCPARKNRSRLRPFPSPDAPPCPQQPLTLTLRTLLFVPMFAEGKVGRTLPPRT